MWRTDMGCGGGGDLCGSQGEGEREDEAGSQHPGGYPPLAIHDPLDDPNQRCHAATRHEQPLPSRFT